MSYTAGNFDSEHLYLQWGGTLPGSEEWSCGVRIASTTPGAFVGWSSGMETAMAAALATFHASADAQIAPSAVLTFMKLNDIGVDGRYLQPITHEHIFANIAGGGTAAKTPPNQVACAVSLLTAVSRGPAHRGRFYMPLPTVTPYGDGGFDPTQRDSIVTAATTLLTALNAADAGHKVAVFSRKSGAAAHRLVTSIKVGRVLDTQRRRRSSLVEAY
jgi:hypothetical protein